MRYLFVLWLGAVGAISYNLIMNPTGGQQQGQALAKIVKYKGKASVRPLGFLSASSARPGQGLHEYDMIFTDADSSMLIEFEDGTLLKLEENSQVKITDRRGFNNEILVTLISGNGTLGRQGLGKSNPLLAHTGGRLSLSKNGIFSASGAMIGGDGQLFLKAKKAPPPPKPVVVAIKKIPQHFPELVPERGRFWSSLPLSEGVNSPIPIRYTRPTDVNKEDWQAGFLVKSGKFQTEQIDSAREPESFAVKLPEGVNQSTKITLSLARGFKSGKTDQELVTTEKNKGLYILDSLAKTQYRSMSYETHEFSSSPPWILQQPKKDLPLSIHLAKGGSLHKLADLVAEQAFSVGSVYKLPKESIYIIKDDKFIGYIDGEAPTKSQALTYLKKLDAQLMYKGRKRAYIGSKRNFNIRKYLKKYPNLYYIHRDRPLLLDRELFKTHKSAKKFLDKFDSHFLREKVEVLATN